MNNVSTLYRKIKILLKYINKSSAIHETTRVSKPNLGVVIIHQLNKLSCLLMDLVFLFYPQIVILHTYKKVKQFNSNGEVIYIVW